MEKGKKKVKFISPHSEFFLKNDGKDYVWPPPPLLHEKKSLPPPHTDEKSVDPPGNAQLAPEVIIVASLT